MYKFDTNPAYSIPKSNRKNSSQNNADVGPGKYNLPEINSIKQNTQKVVFGKSLRQTQKKQDIPGPGLYNTQGRSKIKGAYFTQKYNKLQKQKQVGPGSYDPKKNYNKPKGAIFSTAKNQLNKFSNSPGPGSYYKPELYTDFKKIAQRGTFSYSPKIKGLKRNVPGPGQYQIDIQKKKQNQTFSKTSRQHYKKDQTPGYIYDTYINNLSNKGGYLSKQNYDMKKSQSQIPFYNNHTTYHKKFKHSLKVKFSKAKRDINLSQKDDIPGVGQYNLIQGNQNKGYKFSRSLNKNQNNNIPGPGQYDNNLEAISKKGFKFNKFISNMKSKETPGPGSYNFFKTFKKGQTFGKQNKNNFKENQIPGPGAYQYEQKEKIKMGVIPKDNHNEKVKEIPGPADYELPQMIPLVANYSLKK